MSLLLRRNSSQCAAQLFRSAELELDIRKRCEDMRIYWNLATEPNLATLPRGQRWSVFRAAVRVHVGELRSLIYDLPAGLSAGLGILVGYRLSHNPFLAALAGGIGGWLGGVVSRSLLIRRLAPYLAEDVKAHKRRLDV